MRSNWILGFSIYTKKFPSDSVFAVGLLHMHVHTTKTPVTKFATHFMTEIYMLSVFRLLMYLLLWPYLGF